MDNHIASCTEITKDHKKNPVPKRGDSNNSDQIQQKMLIYGIIYFKKSEINRVEALCKVVLEKLDYAKFENIMAGSGVFTKKFH